MTESSRDAYSWPAHFQPAVVRTGFGGGKLSSFCLALEAWRRGLEVSFLGPEGTRLKVSDGKSSVTFNHSRADRITTEAYNVVESKYATVQALRSAGIPAPESKYFEASTSDFDEILKAAQELHFPVVLKPVRGSVGRGVLANLQDEEQLEAGYRYLVDELKIRRLVLESHHYGNDYRIFVSGGRYWAAVLRIPANVTGDGILTVEELISRKNQTRKKNPFLSGGLITQDYEVIDILARGGHSLNSVPGEGEFVLLRHKANASAGGDVVDVTDTLPQRLQQAAVAAVDAVPGLPAAGVDVLWDENDTSRRESDFVIIEMNSRSHIGVNMYPTQGRGRDIPKVLIDEYFPDTPRRDEESFAELTFDRGVVTAPLRAGLASIVTVAPLPENGFPIRRKYAVSATAHLTAKGRTAINKLTRNLGAVCEIRLAGPRPRVAIGATDETTLRRVHRALAKELGVTPHRISRWQGPLYAGFRVVSS